MQNLCYNKMEDGLQNSQTKSKCSCDTFEKPCGFTKNGLVERMWPIVAIVGVVEAVFGAVLLILVLVYSNHYDKLYDSKVISYMAFGGLAALVISGIALLAALALEKRRVMWFYILSSTSLCIYIFMLSMLKIHFALLIMEKETYKQLAMNKHFLLSTACVVGILTLLGSVIHFIGNVTVLTYYNLRFIHPIMFNCGP